MYTSKTILNIEWCSTGNQWRVFLTGVPKSATAMMALVMADVVAVVALIAVWWEEERWYVASGQLVCMIAVCRSAGSP